MTDNLEKKKKNSNYKGKPKGATNKTPRISQDVISILKINSLAILDKAIEISLKDPLKYNNTLNKLLDKITPNLNVTTNINISKDFEDNLLLITARARALLSESGTTNAKHLLNKEDTDTIKTATYKEIVQTNDKQDDANKLKTDNKDDRGAITDEGGVPEMQTGNPAKKRITE